MVKIQAEIFSLYFFHLGQEFRKRALPLRLVELVQPLCESLVGSNNNPTHCTLASVSFDAVVLAAGGRRLRRKIHPTGST